MKTNASWPFIFLVLCTLPLGGQQRIAEQNLGAAYRTYAEQFTDIGYALPLDNGSLMVSDFGEMTLWRLDGRTGTALAVGRKGSGPKEYQVAGQLLRLPGDTIAMYDAAQARMLLVTAAGDPIRTVTLTTDRLEILSLPQPFAADARGRIYAHVQSLQRGTATDSMRSRIDVVRMQSFTSTRYDTLTTLWFQRLPSVRRPLSSGYTLRVNVNLTSLHSSDAALVSQRGEVVVLRGDDYRLEWFAPDGVKRREVQVAGTRYEVTRDERVKMMEQTRDRTAKGTAHARRLLPAETPTPRIVIEEPDEWPVRKPLFQQGARLSDDGRMYVPVHCAESNRECLDVIDANGQRVVRYKLPGNARFLTANNHFIFLALRDADDLQMVVAYKAR